MRLTRAIGTALAGLGTLTLAACTGSSTPATPTPAPPPVSPPPAPPPPEPAESCTGVVLTVTFRDGDQAAGIGRGELTLEAASPEVGLDFVTPYAIQVPDGGANLDIPGLRPTVGVFVSNLGFSPAGEGFRQTMTIEWISELEVRAGGANCEPVSVSCDLARCAGS